MRYPLTSAVLLAATTFAACGDPQVSHPDGGGFLLDGGSAQPPATPRLDSVPTPIPWPVATLRGEAARAERVIVRGAGNPIASTVLPDGTFCVDVPLPTPETYELSIIGNNAGLVSEGAATASVVFDPSAPPPAGVTMCDGSDPAGCIGTVEICDNSIDDDCNGLRDDRDPACADCIDDVLEPNDDRSAPRLDPGRIDAQICPSNPDFYGIYLRVGDMLTARLFFTHADGDLDMELLDPDGAVLDQSVSTTDDETITFTATVEGEHDLRVYGVGGAQNAYSLDIEVVPAG